MNMHTDPLPGKTGITERMSRAEPTFLRACLLGLCCGLVVVGLMENGKRITQLETANAQAVISAPVSQAPAERANRLDAILVSSSTDR